MSANKSTILFLFMSSLFCGLISILASWQEIPHNEQSQNMSFSITLKAIEPGISYKLIPSNYCSWEYDFMQDNRINIY